LSEPPTRLATALAERYRIERELGAGGMSTVYLALDLKHHRRVALKVLRPELAATMGPERFAREIEVAARLQHPHILGLLDSGDADGFFYYVMPYVEGETLRDRLARTGELPVHEAVRLLAEIADALAVAHRAGVVHRDIKPENVLLSGRHAMVMDFGVAKAVTEASGRQQLTTAGVALGTPAYMAPEQATADPHLDGRVDIYALGVLGYEMLTGYPPFHGLSPQATLAAHVTQAPAPVGQRRPGLSAALESVVMRCLEKRPADRYQTADELVAALEPLATPSGGMTPTETQPVAAVTPRMRAQPWIIGGIVIVLVLLAALALGRRGPETITLGKRAAVTLDPGLEQNPVVSPDGRMVAYRRVSGTDSRLLVQQIGGGAPVPVTAPTTPVLSPPSWSPDGTRLLFASDRGLEVVPALGGAPRLILALPGNQGLVWGDWSRDGKRIAYVSLDSLFVTDIDKPAPRALLGGNGPNSPVWSPDGRWIAYVAGNIQYPTFANLAPSSIWVVLAAGGTPVRITGDQPLNASPAWLPDSRSLLFVSTRDGGRDVYQVHLSRSGAPSRAPARLTTGLNSHTISLSADGRRLAYAASTETANVYALGLVPGRTVSLSAARAVTSGRQTTEGLSVSPDGHWLAFDSDRGGNQDIWRMPIDGSGPPEQLTSTPEDEFQPAYSPDGRLIAFHQTRSGSERDLYVMPAAGGAAVRIRIPTLNNLVPRWSPDGGSLVYACAGEDDSYCVATLSADRKSAVATRQFAPALSRSNAGFNVGFGVIMAWRPDGTSLAGWDGSRFFLVSPEGGDRHPLGATPPGFDVNFLCWSADGRTIYANGTSADRRYSILSVPVDGGPPREVVRSEGPTAQTFRFSFDVHGNTVYMSLADRQSDIWMAEIGTEP
jgi:serine/threonine-protein kinase